MLPRSRYRAPLLLAGALVATAALAAVTPTAATRPVAAAPVVHRVLFDNSKAETAGNADWIISTSMPDPLGQNASPSGETSWTGAISAWGVALQRTGRYSLKTLPAGNTISYGGTGTLDLSKFDTFVMPEPNSPLSAAEKTAIMRFVQNGGGFFLIVDHTNSDRNNDGWDSVRIANDLLTNNGVDNTDPFGFSVDVNNIGTENPRAVSDSANEVLHGPFGTVTGSIIRNGSTQTLRPANNGTVRGLVYRSGYSGNTGAFFTTSEFGAGRVAVWGDSSPVDDGTGQSGNTLYDGWNDPAGTNAALALNATEWLSGGSGDGGGGTGCTAAQLLGNPGFETGTTSPWTATSGVVTNSSAQPAHGGSWKAWLNGVGAANTETVGQRVSIPADCASATLTYWLHIDTAETTGTAYDRLTLTANGTTLATYSNLDARSGYTQHTVDLSGYVGQSVTLTFTGVEGSKLQTSFVLDDTALTVN